MSHITGAAGAKASEAPEKLRVQWVGLRYRCVCRIPGIKMSILTWSNKMRLAPFIIPPPFFFIAGGVCECPFFFMSPRVRNVALHRRSARSKR